MRTCPSRRCSNTARSVVLIVRRSCFSVSCVALSGSSVWLVSTCYILFSRSFFLVVVTETACVGACVKLWVAGVLFTLYSFGFLTDVKWYCGSIVNHSLRRPRCLRQRSTLILLLVIPQKALAVPKRTVTVQIFRGKTLTVLQSVASTKAGKSRETTLQKR